MQLHNNNGNITVIIDVSFDDKDMFMDFILNEQCQFIDSVDPEGLIKFEWFLDEVSNTGTLVEVFEKSDNLIKIGCSIACSGVCLTLTGKKDNILTFDISL